MTKNYRKETEKAIEEVLHEMRNEEIKECLLEPYAEYSMKITASKIEKIVIKYDELLKNYLEAVKEARL